LGAYVYTRKDEITYIIDLKQKVANFVNKRNWEHNPKNLAEAICIEAAELLEIFQWVSNKQALEFCRNTETMKRIKEELADIQIYLMSLANRMELDISEAVEEKMKLNELKYQVKNNA